MTQRIKKLLVSSSLILGLMTAQGALASEIVVSPPTSTTATQSQVNVSAQATFTLWLSDNYAHGVVGVSPAQWRHYVAECPPGSTWIAGVQPGITQQDPNGSYKSCVCNGTGCPTGIQPWNNGSYGIFSWVTCSITMNTTVSQTTLNAEGGVVELPGTYMYCGPGTSSVCTSKPFPTTAPFPASTANFNPANSAPTQTIQFAACT